MNTLFDVLKAKLETEISNKKEYLADGKCDDYSAYRDVCGQIRGLMVAQFEINDLLRKQMEADDE